METGRERETKARKKASVKRSLTSAQKAWTHWPLVDFLKAPFRSPQRPHTRTPGNLDVNKSSHNSQNHGPVDTLLR